MMKTMRRGLALLMTLVMLVTFVPTLFIQVDAANDVNYVYSGKYIYNWGTRGTVATFLSPNAEEFYKDNNTSYEKLSSYSGGTGKSDAPKSALYKELQRLMKSNHTYINAYKENNNLLKYTDCQNSGGKISSFYSGKSIGPAWDSASTWNKEHTWPNSKGLGGSDEDDIMMIRPTSVSENSSRGNTAYGQSSGYYNPNSESNGTYDLRGDTARIFLYIYVRWGNTSYAWGKSGVMESLEVLLAWMEADPVDTWELGRNDSVESITGTRNVFVDYPELAFLLFGENVPTDMVTPSGEASSGNATPPSSGNSGNSGGSSNTGNSGNSGGSSSNTDNSGNTSTPSHNHVFAAWAIVRTATCTTTGLERRDCNQCSDYETREIPALGHTDTNKDNVCDVCAESTHTCKEVDFFTNLINTIINFFRKLLGQPAFCPCGEIVLKEEN